jgi:hypothetical protein
MSVTILRADNGYIVSEDNSDIQGVSNIVVFDVESQGKHAVADMLWHILNTLGEGGSRYDQERIYITIEPGDKYEVEGDGNNE